MPDALFPCVHVVSRAGFAGAFIDREVETVGVCIQFLALEALTEPVNRLISGANTKPIARGSMVCIFIAALFSILTIN
jgi:hypothetical protein